MNLAGLHDLESVAIAPPQTWALSTVALSDNPPPLDYTPSLNWICRINWGYGSAGTLPLPSVYEAFAGLVAAYVNGCTGCSRWIIGNEPNLSREWPDNTPIYPWHYAACYKLCREAIHALPGHEQDEVLIAASGPWNAELKYNSNKNGDWIVYFMDVIGMCGDACDGYSIHAYTHGYDVSLVTSSARMDRPFHNRFYEFYCYRDYCDAIPPALRRLPVYLTEANGNGPWQAVGLMPAMLQEIDSWNHSKLPKIHSVIFYRYSTADEDARFAMSTKPAVMREYQAAVARGYQVPITPISPTPTPPQPTPEPEPDPAPARDIDPRLLARGVHFDYVHVPAGTGYWRITKAQWLDEQEADAVGPDHHMLGTVLRDSDQTPNVPFLVTWPSGNTVIYSKQDDVYVDFNWDYPMSSSLNEYAIVVNDGNPSDKASGIGMGAGGNPSVHTSTWLDFSWTISEGITAPIPPIPPPVQGGDLTHPLPGAVITQHFYQHEENYARFGLIGHNGTDLGGKPEGTPIVSMTDGIVAYTGVDADYGNYVRLAHDDYDCYSFYAHCAAVIVQEGQTVEAGQTIALLGSTGNSTGVHLHFEIRMKNPDGSYCEGTPMRGGRVDPETFCFMSGLKL